MNAQNPSHEGYFYGPNRSVWVTLAWVLGGLVLLAILIGWFHRDDGNTTIGDGANWNEAYEAKNVSATESPSTKALLIGASSADGAVIAADGLHDLDQRMGQRVKVQAMVSRVYEKGVFSLKSENALLDPETLVVMQMDTMPVLNEGMRVVVEGVIRKFEETTAGTIFPAQIGRDEIWNGYQDESVIFVSENLNN